MRFQTGIILKDKSIISGVVRATDPSDAIEKLMGARDIAFALKGYAYPIGQKDPKSVYCRFNMRCSVTGKVYSS